MFQNNWDDQSVPNDIFDENSLNLLEPEEGTLLDKHTHEDWPAYNTNLSSKFKRATLLLFLVIKETVKATQLIFFHVFVCDSTQNSFAAQRI